MTLVNEILKELWESELNYKGVPVNIFGIPKFIAKRERTVSSTLSRLKRRGFVEYNKNGWSITKTGETYYKEKVTALPHFTTSHKKDSPKNLIVMFDIPEKKKVYRDWLRKELKSFGYMLAQQSVWVGPSPLPKGFMEFVDEIGLTENVKTFKFTKEYR